MASGKGYDNAIEKLQKEAADMGCGLVLIHGQTNAITSAMGAGVRVTASAYRIPETEVKPEIETETKPESKEEYVSEEATMFADGTINEKSPVEAQQIGRKFCDEILKDLKHGRTEVAVEKYQNFRNWYDKQSGKNSIIEGKIEKIEKYILDSTAAE